MKSYNGLYERMLTHDEAVASIKEAAKKRRKYRSVRKFMRNLDENADGIINQIRSNEWHPPEHDIVTIREGAHKKERTIQKPIWNNEQIVHHMMMRQFAPILLPRLNRFCCGSIPGRSTHFLLRSLNSWVKSYKGKRFYVAELDVRKFYDSIDNELLISKLRETIRDKQYLSLLEDIITTSAPGLPKGFFTSPYLSHFYMLDADNYALQELKPDHYARFVDNVWMFGRNKKELHRKVELYRQYLEEHLHLHIKDDWQVFRFEGVKSNGRAINLLGFVIHRNRITLRKSLLERIRRKANRMYNKHKCTVHDAMSMVSRMGWITWSDTYGYYTKYIKPKVNIQYCKRRVGAWQRRRNYERLAHCT